MSNSNDHAASDEAPADPGDQLIQWAKEKFGELTRAEESMLSAAAAGDVADVSSSIYEENDPGKASSWPKDRSIRAGLLRWLCVDRYSSKLVDPKGIRVKGARFDGPVDLESAIIPFGLTLIRCAILAGLNLEQGVLQWLTLDGTQISGVVATELRVKNSISLCNGFKAHREVRLMDATIGGQLKCRNGIFLNMDGDAICADRVNVTGSVFLDDGFVAHGAVRFLGATIGGQLNCYKGKFLNKEGAAFFADSIKVKADVLLDLGFEASNKVSLLGATIGGQLNCRGGKFLSEEGASLSADGVQVKRDVLLDRGFEASGEVRLLGATIGGQLNCQHGTFVALNLQGIQIDDAIIVRNLNFSGKPKLNLTAATIGSVVDDKESWPDSLKDNLLLDGFQYKRFAGDKSPTDSVFRIRWLELQKSTPFHPQPYEQLAKVFREMGHNRDARDVLVAKEDAYRKHGEMMQWIKPWHWLLGFVFGYGYRMHRGGGFLLIFFIIGWALFAWGERANLLWPTDRSAIVDIDIDGQIFAETGQVREGYQSLSPLMYSLDTLVPIVDFHQQKYWLPNAEQGRGGWLLRLYLWVHIAAGWFFSTMLAISMTPLARSK